MSILTVDHLTQGFGDRTILSDVSFRLLAGEHIGFIGANGEGKSTFFRIISGQLHPDGGTIEWAKDTVVGYLDQHSTLEAGLSIRDVLHKAFDHLHDKNERMTELYTEMAECSEERMEEILAELGDLQTAIELSDFYTLDAKIEEVAKALGLTAFGLDTDVTALSGGQRSKVLLAKLLLSKPDILLLDEPTNYLDIEHIQWLQRFLTEYEGAFVLISHDMSFLNSVVNVIYHVEYARLERYAGDYENFLQVYDMQKSQKEAAFKKQQQEISELKDFVARNKANVATRNMAMSRQKKLDKMDLITLDKQRPEAKFSFQMDRAPARVVFESEQLVIGYEEPLSKALDLKLERGMKAVLLGANGIGKSTLLKSLLGLIPAVSGKSEIGDYVTIGYFEQEYAHSPKKTCLDEIWDTFPSMTNAEARAALARCGLTTKHIESRLDVLSGGEQARVRLCVLMNQKFNVLVLDEPTNHLDRQAKEALREALINFPGTILMTCHEPDFYEGIVSEVWDAAEWSLRL